MATTPPRKTTTKRKAAPRTARTAKPKAAAPRVTAPAAPAAETAPIPKVVKVSEPAAVQPDLKKKELLEEVVLRSGVKKKDAKPVVEAMLDFLGQTLAEGRDLNLPPMGKLRINRTQEHASHRVVVCKLRQQIRTGDDPEKDPLADAAE